MKTALLLSLFSLSFAFVGCESKSENCEYNGKKVACSEMPSANNKPKGPSSAFSIEVKAKGRYEIKNGKLKFLETISNSIEKNVEGTDYTCEINANAGLTFEAEANERELTLRTGAEQEIYERSSNSKVNEDNLFIGQFWNDLDDTKSILTLDENEIEIHTICTFK